MDKSFKPLEGFHIPWCAARVGYAVGLGIRRGGRVSQPSFPAGPHKKPARASVRVRSRPRRGLRSHPAGILAPTDAGNCATMTRAAFRHDFEHDDLIVHRPALARRRTLGG